MRIRGSLSRALKTHTFSFSDLLSGLPLLIIRSPRERLMILVASLSAHAWPQEVAWITHLADAINGQLQNSDLRYLEDFPSRRHSHRRLGLSEQ